MADHLGEQFGEYRLIRKLGGGNFGDVYLGEHIRDNTPAAVKVLQARLTHQEDLKDFINEVRTLFRLQHPNIVPLLDFGIERDAPFLIMAYAPHGTLRQPRGTRLPEDTVVTYIRQVAEALQFAHDRRLIHRDVKPDNILLGPNGQVWLSDFGITTIAHSSRSLNTQDSAGTITYMAPEQIQGKPRAASDQYALGIITYEWICGERPFNGTAIEVAMQHAQATPPPLREKMPTLSHAIEQVVMKALEKDYEKRYGSVREFAEALAEVVNVAIDVTRPALSRTNQQQFDKSMNVAVEQPKSAPRKSIEQWLVEGNAHYRAGRYKEAVESYNLAIAHDSQNAASYIARGIAYFSLKEYEQAIDDFSRSITLDPQNAEAFGGRGLAYYQLKQYKLAIQDYDRTIALNPKGSGHFYFTRGNAYSGLKQYERAIEDYDRAILLRSQLANSYGGRGLAYYHLDDYQRAAQDFDYALKLKPSIDWFQSEREDAYRKLRKAK